MLKKIFLKFKTKHGNSYLFMPYFVTFGTMLMYMMMEMGTAYVRQIELQTVTDAVARGGVYGGMTGSGAGYYSEADHVYVNLDDAVALAVANAILEKNAENLKSFVTSGDAKLGQIKITDVQMCEKNRISEHEKIPIWTRANNPNGTYNPSGNSGYTWTEIGILDNAEQVMSTGNFFVTIEGEYKTLVAGSVIGKDSLTLEGFASALATATRK